MPVSPTAVVERVRALAEAKPDFRYLVPDGESCKYYPDPDIGLPGCIVGQALEALGLDPIKVEESSVAYDLTYYQGPGRPAERVFGDVPEDDDDLDWLGIVQRLQDASAPWGVAVATADRAYELDDWQEVENEWATRREQEL